MLSSAVVTSVGGSSGLITDASSGLETAVGSMTSSDGGGGSIVMSAEGSCSCAVSAGGEGGGGVISLSSGSCTSAVTTGVKLFLSVD